MTTKAKAVPEQIATALGQPPPGLEGQALKNWEFLTPHYFRAIATLREQEHLIDSYRAEKKLQVMQSTACAVFSYHTRYGRDDEVHELALRVARAVQGRLITRRHERDREREDRLAKGLETKAQKAKAQKAKQAQHRRAYYEKNREKILQAAREYHAAHREEKAQYRAAHREEKARS